jgi:hypothetical protein
MNLVQQAINTYKAIHGEEPKYEPYRGASDHPFEGVDPSLMKDLVNATEVRKIERKFKINLNKTHKSKEEIKVGDYVHAKKLNSYSDNVIKQGRVLFMSGNYYGVVDFNSLNYPFLVVRQCTPDLLKKRSPEPGERDGWEDAESKSHKLIQEPFETTVWSEVRKNPSLHLAKYVHSDPNVITKYMWIEYVPGGNILKVRTNKFNKRDTYSPDRWVFASKVQIAEPSSTTSNQHP